MLEFMWVAICFTKSSEPDNRIISGALDRAKQSSLASIGAIKKHFRSRATPATVNVYANAANADALMLSTVPTPSTRLYCGTPGAPLLASSP